MLRGGEVTECGKEVLRAEGRRGGDTHASSTDGPPRPFARSFLSGRRGLKDVSAGGTRE